MKTLTQLLQYETSLKRFDKIVLIVLYPIANHHQENSRFNSDLGELKRYAAKIT